MHLASRHSAVAAWLLAGCAWNEPDPLERGAGVDFAAASALAEPSCEQRIAAVLAAPALPGAPELEAARAQVLSSAKAEPVLFVARPRLAPDARQDAVVYASRLARTRHPWDVLGQLLPVFQADPEAGRQTLLRDGYLYAETALLAYALYDRVRPEHLFSTDRIWIQRGETLRWAVRDGAGRYGWEDAPAEPLQLILFDRVGSDEPPPPLHRDLRSLRYRLHFERARVRRITREHLVADLRYGPELWVPSLLRTEGARLELECEAGAPDAERERAARHARALATLRQAMLDQIEEALPFEEPLTEIGQQDGRLRFVWQWAYDGGRESYRFGPDHYPVFDASGRPRPPQVCIDFMLDSFERASGTWWRPRAEARGRIRGKLDFDDHDRRALRSIQTFARFAESKPDWFELRSPEPAEQIGIGWLEPLTEALLRSAGAYQSGDMVVVHGFTPWDARERHFHSFFIYETDPMSGFPLLVVGNAGRPTIRIWRIESNRTPKRQIVQRIRPRLEWLESILPLAAEPLLPPPLVASTD
jgi:hypothetical protein